MGMTLWVHTLEDRTMSKESDDHTMMWELADALDALCVQLKVEKLSSFFDETDLALNMREDEDDGAEEREPDRETGLAYGIDAMDWYDAASGLATMLALRHAIARDPGELDDESATQLLEELNDLIDVLDGPATRGGRFNLPVIM